MNWTKSAVKTGALAIGALMAGAGAAQAGVSEVHVGVMAHNIRVIDDKNADKEDGPAIELEANFDSPGFLHWAGRPEPYIVASVNVAGETSFAGVGLEWRWEFADGWALQPGLGYVIHDGELENPYPNGSPEAADFAAEHVLLGSRDLFRTSLGLSREFGEHWSGQVFYSHLSHGQILGEGRNQGMDQIGLRIGYRFGG
ncbi:MAG: acyloxyacyl hydrolase [Hyphomonadaceae bacterium]